MDECSISYKNYPNSTPLPAEPFYTDKYNNIRRLKALTISHHLGCYDAFKYLPYDKKNIIIYYIENSCVNETLRKARNNNQRCVWDNNQFVNIYHDVCYKTISIIASGDENLIKKIAEVDVEFLKQFGMLSCKELLPEQYSLITHIINKRVNTERTVKYTEMFFCKKCKRNQTTIERVQNRSNDESSSFFVTCLFCGTKWFT